MRFDGPSGTRKRGRHRRQSDSGGRCAVARYIGSRDEVRAAAYLYETWLPSSGETLRECPVIFHYVNVGPNVPEHEMITDVYLPIV